MVEQIPISCHSCKKVFNEVLEEAKKYSKSNPFICHLCMSPASSPSQKIVDHELYAHSRQNDSQTLNDPVVIDAHQSRSDNPPPIHPNHNTVHLHIPIPHLHHEEPTESVTTTNPPPQPNTLQYYESIATGPIKAEIDKLKAKREQKERELEEERERTRRYANEGGGGGMSILPIAITGIIMILIMVAVFSTVLPSVTSSLTCPAISNASDSPQVQAWKTSCNTLSTHMTIVPVLIALMVIITTLVLVARILV